MPVAFAQQYIDYPQYQGKAAAAGVEVGPGLGDPDMDLRERTEAPNRP